jgi:hypothetical protein
MLKSGVFSFSVFSDGDNIDIIVGGLDSWESFAGSNVSEELKLLSQGNVKRSMAFSDGSFEGT